jgi:hypothetical protein
MKSLLFVFVVAAICGSASAGVMLNIPSQVVSPPLSQHDLSLDLGFA